MSTQYWGAAKLQAPQTVAYTGTAGHTTNVVGNGVYKVRIVCTTDAFVLAHAPTDSDATTSTGHFWPANSVEYMTVNPGQRISAIQLSSGGNMYVSEAT